MNVIAVLGIGEVAALWLSCLLGSLIMIALMQLLKLRGPK